MCVQDTCMYICIPHIHCNVYKYIPPLINPRTPVPKSQKHLRKALMSCCSLPQGEPRGIWTAIKSKDAGLALALKIRPKPTRVLDVTDVSTKGGVPGAVPARSSGGVAGGDVPGRGLPCRLAGALLGEGLGLFMSYLVYLVNQHWFA